MRLLLLSCLFLVLLARRSSIVDLPAISLPPHGSLNLTFNSLDSLRAVAVTLHHPPKTTPRFQLELQAGKTTVSCTFLYGSNLCVLDAGGKEVSMRVLCGEVACAFTLVVSQHVAVQVPPQEQFNRVLPASGVLLQLPLRNTTALLQIYSQREEHRLLAEELVVSCNVHAFLLEQVQELDSSSALFGLKPVKSSNQQWVLVEGDHLKKHQDLRISVRSHGGLLRESFPIVDFLQTFGNHSKNLYSYASTFSRNIQINLRVFAPRDTSSLPVTLAVVGPNREDIRRLILPSLAFQGQKFADITFVIGRSQHNKYGLISFELQLGEVADHAVFVELEARDCETCSVTIFERVFFGVEKGETMQLVVEPQVRLSLSEGDRDIAMLIRPEQNYFSSTQSCSILKGCKLAIKAQDRCEACSFSFDLSGEKVSNHVVFHEVIGELIEGRIDAGEEMYFRFAVGGAASVRLSVSSVNVMLYASFEGYTRCKVPIPQCHQYAISHQTPLVVTNQNDQPAVLFLGLRGLQRASFQVRLQREANGLQLRLGQKYTYLFDDEETQVKLKLAIDKTVLKAEDHLSFTVIAPVGSVRMRVANVDGLTLAATDGFLLFPHASIVSDVFEVRLIKIGPHSQDFVHVTVLAGVAGQAVRLDQTSIHYEKYPAAATRKFLLEFDPAQRNALNFFTVGLEKSQSAMKLLVREVGEDGQLFEKRLVRDSEWLDLDEELERAGVCAEVNCELQVQVRNEGREELEQSVTLLAEQPVIALQDSVWSGWEMNELTRSSHFYFLPKHANRTITVLFHTDDARLFLTYRIHNTNASANPQEWPFQHASPNTQMHPTTAQTIEIPADDPALQVCWPTCAVLLNVNDAGTAMAASEIIQSYRILATDSIIELPEDTRIELTLKSGEEKALFIRLSKFLHSERFTFFTYISVGRARLTASVMAGDEEIALGREGEVFVFDPLETAIPLYIIESVLRERGISGDDALLKVAIAAESLTKLRIEFSTYLREIYRLRMDELQVATLRKGEEVWYEFVPQRDFSMKFYRLRGFPFLKVIKCDEEGYVECLSRQKKMLARQVEEKMKIKEVVKEEKEPQIVANANKDELQVFVEKSLEVHEEHCLHCIYFVWIYCFEGDLQLSINVRSSNSEIELKQMAVLDETLQPKQRRRYLFNTHPHQDAILTIRILDGFTRIHVADLSGLLFNQTLDAEENDYRDYTIDALAFPAKIIEKKEDPIEERPHMNPSPRPSPEILRKIYISVENTGQKQAEFLVSYSIGQSGQFLQDGVVAQKKLGPDSPHTFLYHNNEKESHAYLTLSSQLDKDYLQVGTANQFLARFYYYPDASRRDEREEFLPELPPSRNENYLGSTRTMVYELPAKFELLQVEISSQARLKLTASINHKELIYLPLGFDYLIKLHPQEALHLVIDRPNSQYLQVKLRKCDGSRPSLYYTNSAQQFKNGIFSAEADIDSPLYRESIKTNPDSKTIHLKLVGDLELDSMFTVSVTASSAEQKMAVPRLRAGDQGLLHYQIIKSNEIQVRFKPATCNNSPCPTPLYYYLMVADSLDALYGELNCAGNSFVGQPEADRHQAEVITLTKSAFDGQSGEYRHVVHLSKSRAVMVVKAVLLDIEREEVTYVPLQINSLWGELSKLSLGVVLLASMSLSVLITGVVVISTRLARRGYRPIASNE